MSSIRPIEAFGDAMARAARAPAEAAGAWMDGTPEKNDTVTAVLGPTNTGKTHYAIERMLATPPG